MMLSKHVNYQGGLVSDLFFNLTTFSPPFLPLTILNMQEVANEFISDSLMHLPILHTYIVIICNRENITNIPWSQRTCPREHRHIQTCVGTGLTVHYIFTHYYTTFCNGDRI